MLSTLRCPAVEVGEGKARARTRHVVPFGAPRVAERQHQAIAPAFAHCLHQGDGGRAHPLRHVLPRARERGEEDASEGEDRREDEAAGHERS